MNIPISFLIKMCEICIFNILREVQRQKCVCFLTTKIFYLPRILYRSLPTFSTINGYMVVKPLTHPKLCPGHAVRDLRRSGKQDVPPQDVPHPFLVYLSIYLYCITPSRRLRAGARQCGVSRRNAFKNKKFP